MTELPSGYLCCFIVVLQITSSVLIAHTSSTNTHTRNDVIGESDHVDVCVCVCLGRTPLCLPCGWTAPSMLVPRGYVRAVWPTAVDCRGGSALLLHLQSAQRQHNNWSIRVAQKAKEQAKDGFSFKYHMVGRECSHAHDEHTHTHTHTLNDMSE